MAKTDKEVETELTMDLKREFLNRVTLDTSPEEEQISMLLVKMVVIQLFEEVRKMIKKQSEKGVKVIWA